MTDDHSHYEVGYRKPPKQTQFKKGASGNPSGRPKGSRNLGTIIRKAARQRIKVTDQNGERRISKVDATAIQLANQAASGNQRAMQLFLHLYLACVDSEQREVLVETTEEADRLVMQSLVQRIRESGDEPEPNSNSNDPTDVAWEGE